jgi:hypothetical protein
MDAQRVFVIGMQGSSRIVLFRSLDGGANWSGPAQISDATNLSVFQPRIAVNPSQPAAATQGVDVVAPRRPEEAAGDVHVLERAQPRVSHVLTHSPNSRAT